MRMRGKGADAEQATATGPEPTVTAPIKRGAQRQAWNASTRLSVRTQARANSGDNGGGLKARRQRLEDVEATHEDRTSEAHRPEPHSRCSSPSCRERRARRQVRITHAAVADATSHQPLPAVDSTRAMIERAVDAALSSAMESADLTLDKSVEVVEEHMPLDQGRHLLDLLTRADADASEWRRQYVHRREHNDRVVTQQQGRTHRAVHVQRVIRSARFEYEQRKLEIQSLQQRVAREIHFLQATSAELVQREKLMDEAFAGYEQWVETEWEEDNARAG